MSEVKELKPKDSKEAEVDIKKVDNDTILKLSFDRADNGDFKIMLKSQVNWDVLKRKDRSVVRVGGINCYRATTERFPGMNAYFHTEHWEYENYPNMMLLLAQGVQEGVTFDFGQLPVSTEKIRDWITKMKQQTKVLYLSYIKPINITLTISSQTVEREEHS